MCTQNCLPVVNIGLKMALYKPKHVAKERTYVLF